MKPSHRLHSLFIFVISMAAAMLAPWPAVAQISSPEQIASQTELEKSIPKMQITDEFLQLKVPDQTMGETVGVSRNSKGHLFVYSRTNPQGISRGGTAAMLFEFDQNLKFV